LTPNVSINHLNNVAPQSTGLAELELIPTVTQLD
jgi:hypothetical protein